MDLMSSLLVWQDGQLLPASSGRRRVVADECVAPNAATARGPEEVRPHTPSNAVNPQTTRAHAHDSREILRASSGAKRKRSTEGLHSVKTVTLSSPPTAQHTKDNQDPACLLPAANVNEHPPAHQVRFELDNMPPPSAQLAGADFDMLRGGGHDLGLTHPSDLLPSDLLDEDEFPTGPLVGLEGIEEYEKANPFTPPPPRKGVPRRLSKNNGIHSSTFWMACQDRGLQSEFDFREREQACFYVSLKVNGQTIDEVGPYASKKDAKEAICEKNIGRLEAFGSHKKRKSSGHQQEVVSLTPEGFEDENWIGVLTEYLQTKQLPPAEYGPSGLHPSMGPWFCTVRFPGSPLTPFGHGTGPFARKDEAKKVAAMEAVHWLRQQGLLDQSANKRQKSHTSPKILAPGDTGLTQSVQNLAVQSENSPPRTHTTNSLPQQVHTAALRLGFTQPAFLTEQLEGAFVNMWAAFNPNDARKEPRLAGEVCRIGPVYGKKTAKDECCRELLGLLGEIEQSRQTLT